MMWLDGPQFLKWVEAHGFDCRGRYARRAYDWQRGARVNVYTADRVLVELGHHLNELPDDMWVRTWHRGNKRAVPKELKAAVRRDRRAGYSRKWVAHKHGVGLASVTRWAK
jgi:hypothetical protein